MSIFRSAGCVLLHVVFSTVKGLVIFYSAEHHMQQYTTCTHEDGHIDVRNM